MMDFEILFNLAIAFVLPAWVLLAAAPRWHWARRLILSCLIPLALALLYSILIICYLGRAQGSFMSLAGVQQLFETPGVLLAGWIHYLVFDLLVGMWQTDDAIKNGIPGVLRAPCLILTFLLGPMGFLAYFISRTVYLRRLGL